MSKFLLTIHPTALEAGDFLSTDVKAKKREAKLDLRWSATRSSFIIFPDFSKVKRFFCCAQIFHFSMIYIITVSVCFSVSPARRFLLLSPFLESKGFRNVPTVLSVHPNRHLLQNILLPDHPMKKLTNAPAPHAVPDHMLWRSKWSLKYTANVL